MNDPSPIILAFYRDRIPALMAKHEIAADIVWLGIHEAQTIRLPYASIGYEVSNQLSEGSLAWNTQMVVTFYDRRIAIDGENADAIQLEMQNRERIRERSLAIGALLLNELGCDLTAHQVADPDTCYAKASFGDVTKFAHVSAVFDGSNAPQPDGGNENVYSHEARWTVSGRAV